MSCSLFRMTARMKPYRPYNPIMGPVVRWTGVAIGLSGFFLIFLGVLKADQIRSWWDADYVLALKGNQETVHEEVKTFLMPAGGWPFQSGPATR